MISWLNCLPLFFSVSIHHVLLMSNHIHLLATPNEDNIGSAMSYLLTNLAKYLNHQNNSINHIFGNRYIPTIIRDKRHLINVIRYIYQNPVRGGVSNRVFDYPYSSLGQYLGINDVGLIVDSDQYTYDLFQFGLKGREKWVEHIDTILNDQDSSCIRKSLTRSFYKLSQRQQIQISKEGTSIVI